MEHGALQLVALLLLLRQTGCGCMEKVSDIIFNAR